MVIHVVIPCYAVRRHILKVISDIGVEITAIHVVDDACPENTGSFVEVTCRDSRVQIHRHQTNQGVGGAVITGMQAALAQGADIVIKIDGDGQMNPTLIPKFVKPLQQGHADYTKGNRFYQLEYLHDMPLIRLLGNAALSFFSKLSSGYWGVMDSTNGYFAIHAKVAATLPLDKIARGYFFESDLLFRLNLLRAVVEDIPMPAIYRDERSNLSVIKATGQFAVLHTIRLFKRVFYNYFLRDFNAASLMLLAALPLLGFGVVFGIIKWYEGIAAHMTVSSGTVMLSALPVILGLQLLLSALQYDIYQQPQFPIHNKL
jgi:glycosyltransferase involved in cell wall biosynthesis